jgi:predicted Zn-dependent protease
VPPIKPPPQRPDVTLPIPQQTASVPTTRVQNEAVTKKPEPLPARDQGNDNPTKKPEQLQIRAEARPSGTTPPPSRVTPSQPMRTVSASPTPPPTDASEHGALEEMIDQGRVDDALSAYRMLSKRHPTDRYLRAGIELCEGMLALAQRDRLEAAQRFEAALEIDPSNERAARQLAEMRRQATNERKGLLSRLMGKKE